jgi:hypothetical protein
VRSRGWPRERPLLLLLLLLLPLLLMLQLLRQLRAARLQGLTAPPRAQTRLQTRAGMRRRQARGATALLQLLLPRPMRLPRLLPRVMMQAVAARLRHHVLPPKLLLLPLPCLRPRTASRLPSVASVAMPKPALAPAPPPSAWRPAT